MKSLIKKTNNGEITLNDVQGKIIKVRNQRVLLDSDVAALYAVKTKEVNQAIQRNLSKFPAGYILQLDDAEWQNLKSSQLTLKKDGEEVTNCDLLKGKIFSNVSPKAFTEKGLYMLATILKGKRAEQTTIAIVEAFTKMRELSTAVVELVKSPDDLQKQAAVTLKSNKILSDMVTKELKTTGTKTSFEFNLFSAIKIKHTVKKEVK